MAIKQSLLGMFQQQPDQLQTLLGQYYDPKQAKMQWLGGTLQGLGAGLASGEPGAWAQGAIAGGGQGVDDYRQQAMLGYKVAENKAADEYARAQDEQNNAWRQQQWDYKVGQDKLDNQHWNQQFGLQQQRAAQAQAGGGNEYGLNPVWARDAQGNWQLFQPSKGGGAPAQVQFPPGVAPQPQVSFQDLGTSVQPVTTRGAIPTGQPLPKDLAGAESQKAQGEVAGKSIAAAPADIQAADNALALVEDIKKDPYLDRGTGFSSYGNSLRGTGGYDFQNKVDQAKSGAFLSAIQQMRGMGALSDTEGKAATAAVNRMNTATSSEAFLAALDDYENRVKQGRARAEARLKSGGAVATPQAIQTDDGYTIEPVQ